MKHLLFPIATVTAVLFLCATVAPAAPAADPRPPASEAGTVTVQTFLDLAHRDERVARQAAERLDAAWKDDYLPLIVDVLQFAGRGRPAGDGGFGTGGMETSIGADAAAGATAPRVADVADRIHRYLKRRTGASPGATPHDWSAWLWGRPARESELQRPLRRALYGQVDPALAAFFQDGTPSRIRLDEILWGGTKVDGIPPLDHPATVPAGDADWLKDRHEIFGVVYGGEARAYPRRIVAWHELVRDRLGDAEITLVYCTLCDSAIPWKNEVAGRDVTLGTSGLLYRSNKLMYDAETGSLWSALKGRPVLGPLAGFDVRLQALPVVATTWGEWRRAHPDTRVLSLDTGFERDYGEGVAYRDYFRSKRPWYPVAGEDGRLPPKTRVHVLELAGPGGEPVAAAIADGAFDGRAVFAFDAAGLRWVALRDDGGGVRVYQSPAQELTARRDDGMWVDANGTAYRATESALIPLEAEGAAVLPRVPSHDAYWFGWAAQHPGTLLFGR